MAESTRPDLESRIDDEVTGLPGLASWASVYLFVLGSFVVWVVLLSLLSRAFS
jgi:hypothetical protein